VSSDSTTLPRAQRRSAIGIATWMATSIASSGNISAELPGTK
jgi:hypothetical protein